MAYQGFLNDRDHDSNQSAELDCGSEVLSDIHSDEANDECLSGRFHDSLQLDEHQNAADVHSDIHDGATTSHSAELQNGSDFLADIPVDGATSSNQQLPESTSLKNESTGWKLFKRFAPSVAVGVGAVVAAPFVLSAVGFGAAGITVGSLAAKMMSAAAVSNGGVIAAESLVAILQSAGALGLSGTASVTIGAATSSATFVGQEIVSKISKKGADDKNI